MKRVFRAKMWIDVAILVVTVTFALFGLGFGIPEWMGLIADANGQFRTDAGPPLVITGCICVLLSAGLVWRLLFIRNHPLVSCYAEGMDCYIGRRRFIVRWEHLKDISIAFSLHRKGRVITFNGNIIQLKTGKLHSGISYVDARFVDSVDTVAEACKAFRAAENRAGLPSWNAPEADPLDPLAAA
jgi:hypothetical protein